jgi:hypothetical protein
MQMPESSFRKSFHPLSPDVQLMQEASLPSGHSANPFVHRSLASLSISVSVTFVGEKSWAMEHERHIKLATKRTRVVVWDNIDYAFAVGDINKSN